jgi:hypothetical protein
MLPESTRQQRSGPNLDAQPPGPCAHLERTAAQLAINCALLWSAKENVLSLQPILS